MLTFRSPHLLAAACAVVLCAAVSADMPEPIPVAPQGASGLFSVHMDGRPPESLPPPSVPPLNGRVSTAAGGKKILSGMPSYTWCFGSANTAAAMVFGYYDRHGYPDMYTGPENGGVQPLYNERVWLDHCPSPIHGECPVAASHKGFAGRTTKGHVDDFWHSEGSLEDPCFDETPPWAPHQPWDCTGDWMYTSRADKQNADGDTQFFLSAQGNQTRNFQQHEPNARDGAYGMKLFAQSRGYGVADVFNQLILPTPTGYSNSYGFTYDDFQAEIDEGRPVLLMIGPHVVVGYGYDNTGGAQLCYMRTTWDCDEEDKHRMRWGGQWAGEYQWAVSVLVLDPPPGDPKPDLQIKAAGGQFVGIEDYGAGQTAYGPIMPGETSVYSIVLTNRDNVTDSFTVTGDPTPADWSIAYFGPGDVDITAEVTGAGWASPSVPGGSSGDLRLEVTPLASAAPGSTATLSVTAASNANPARTDTVNAATRKLSSDLSDDGDVDQADFGIFVQAFRGAAQGGAVDPTCDMDADGDIDHEDVEVFTTLFLAGQ